MALRLSLRLNEKLNFYYKKLDSWKDSKEMYYAV
jgi:hypothetical protein